MFVWTISVLGSVCFAIANVVARRGLVYVADATIGIMLSVPVGLPYYLAILAVIGQVGSLFSFSWQNYLWLAGAGIVHYVLGRSLNYRAMKLIGANLTNIILGISPLVTAIIAISVLRETFTWRILIGTLLVTFGLMGVGVTRETFQKGGRLFPGVSRTAILCAAGAGTLWGLTPIMVKMGLSGTSGVGAPIAGAFVSHAAATIVLAFNLRRPDKRASLFGMKGRAAVFFVLSGLSIVTAHLVRYIALSMAPASVVTPPLSISPVFVLLFSFLINRKIEILNLAVILGTIAMVVGAILVV
ncbi:MAG: DMT family transporter [Chloroflexi bacterium]|nr:DMT family transporter [Chloroflexota bacterium]